MLEVLTLKQLGYHTKPVVVLDLDGFYEPLWTQIQRGIDEGFIKPEFLPRFNGLSRPSGTGACHRGVNRD